MRRIPRLRRPLGLPSSTSRTPTAPLVVPCSSASCQTTSASHHRPTPATFQSLATTRFYSSDRQQPDLQNPNRGTELAPVVETSLVPAEGDVQIKDRPSRQWGTFVPPPKRSHADHADEVEDTSYMPALTSEGLATVGGLERWWEQPEHWSKSVRFTGFKPTRKVVHPALLEALIRRAVVEAFALRQAGREEELVGAWPTGGDLQRLVYVGINVAGDGTVSLTGNVSSLLDSLTWKDGVRVSEESTSGTSALGSTPRKRVLSVKLAQTYNGAAGNGWEAAPLPDLRIKFAITKRFFQLTGRLVPDHQLSSITDVRSLLRAVLKPPKSKTLTQEIQERQKDLVMLPNVSVATKRVTRGDREKALGRFKLIEEELKKRSLPLQGHGFVRKNKELSRLKGEA
ncbi:ribosomal subunit 39S-domain-containing protein [Hypoxylon sp. NC1633]|nr:ribosomal subunit 39S-domain-containing protein [Hypoxylon sp. NC1633]